MDNKKTIYLCHKNHQYMIYKIVKGNSFLLHIKMQKAYIAENKQMLEDLNVEEIDSLKVYLNNMFGEERELKTRRIGITNRSLPINEIQVFFPSNIEEGIYGITIKGKYYGNDICSIEHKLFAIVSTNAKSHIPLGLVEGEQSGMYNGKYWLELNISDEIGLSYYGASSIKDADLIKTELLEEAGSLRGTTLKITTTEQADTIWFISKVSLRFSQGGLPLELNEDKIGEMYYYHSDPLEAGENIITIE